MHPIFFTMIGLLFLSLFLSISTATDVIWSPSTWPPKVEQHGYYSDVLNITKCYCQGLNEDSNAAGHYYQFDYHNYYNDQDYTLGWTCLTDIFTTGWGKVGGKKVHFPLPDCWNAHDSWREKKRKVCGRSSNGDEFCYETGNSHDPYDYYYFNGQKKGLPDHGIMEFPPYQCADWCRDKVGGKAVASDTEGGWEKSLPSVDNRLTTLKSSYKSYVNLDDMTANHNVNIDDLGKNEGD